MFPLPRGHACKNSSSEFRVPEQVRPDALMALLPSTDHTALIIQPALRRHRNTNFYSHRIQGTTDLMARTNNFTIDTPRRLRPCLNMSSPL